MPTRPSMSIGVLAGRLLADVVVDPVGLDDLVADRVERVHRGQRVLEDHRHLLAAQPAHAPRGRRRRAPRRRARSRRRSCAAPALVQAHDRQAGHALAGAGLADDAEGLARARAWKDRPSTDLTRPSSVGKCTRRSRTSRNGRPGGAGRPASTRGAHASAERRRRGSLSRTLGSTTAYRRSTTRLARTTKTRPSSVTPSTFGRSLLLMASTAYLPMPGQREVVSVRIAPPSSRPRSRPKIVRIGVSAARRPCLTTTVALRAGPWPGRCGCSPRSSSPACPRGSAGRTPAAYRKASVIQGRIRS